ncbi:hypothetical protein ACFWDN_13110 [Micromonospora chalcea]
MSTMLVYRVENADQQGPYVGLWQRTGTDREVCSALHEAHNAPGARSTHPGPHRDQGLRRYFKYLHGFDMDSCIFGFSDRQQLAQWFGGWGRQLQRAGYRVSVYRVPVAGVIGGQRQAIFARHAAERVASLLPTRVLS